MIIVLQQTLLATWQAHTFIQLPLIFQYLLIIYFPIQKQITVLIVIWLVKYITLHISNKNN